jgi:hypothetical protein
MIDEWLIKGRHAIRGWSFKELQIYRFLMEILKKGKRENDAFRWIRKSKMRIN